VRGESLENYERGLAVCSGHPTAVLVADASAWLTSSV